MGDLTLVANPEHCPGDYVLHLYCRYKNPDHRWDEFPWQVTDCETGGAARSAARKMGWILHRDRTATCPKCARILAAKKDGRQ